MKLKNFIFIDNDDQTDHNVERTLEYSQAFIRQCGVDDFSWDDHQKEFGYWRLGRDKQTDLIMGSPQQPTTDILVTWSVYTVGQMANSKAQMLNMLKAFGSYYINNRVYLDTSGMIRELLQDFLSESDGKGQAAVIRTIENNYIITIGENGKPARLRFNRQVRDYTDKRYILEEGSMKDLFYA